MPVPDSTRLAREANCRQGRRWLSARLVAGLVTIAGGMAIWLAMPHALKWQVRRDLSARDYTAARRDLDRLDTWFGHDGESSFLRARLGRKLGDWDAVRQLLLRARDQKYPVELLEREQWLALAQSGQLRAAEPHLSRLLTDPRDDGAEICEAYVNGYFVNYRLSDAVKLLDAWIADFPKDPEPRLIRGKIRAEQQFLKEAESDLREARSLDSRSAAIALELADVLVLQRRVEEAVALYRQAALSGTHPVRARVGEAKSLRLLNRPDQARSVAEEILAEDKSNREARLELGLADLDLGHIDDAIAGLQQALQQNPRSLVVRQALARALRENGNLDQAREHAAYVAEAQAALQRADALTVRVTTHPNDAKARHEIGSIYLKYAVPERGVQWLKSALNCDPNHHEAKKALEEYLATGEAASVPADGAAIAMKGAGKSAVSGDLDRSSLLRFRERMPVPGQEFAYRNGDESDRSTILEGMGGGVAVFDYDLDGNLDLLYPGGGEFAGTNSLAGHPTALFRNRGDWQFDRTDGLAAFPRPTHYTHGVAIGDYDNDGFQDVVVTGYGGLQLLHNQGDGTFADVTDPSGLVDRLWSTSAAWGDFDGDGALDLYVTHYVDWSFENDPLCPTVDGKKRERCPPQRYEGLPDSLYRSRGDGQFVDESVASGLRRDGKGLGVVVADLDLDGDVDIYVGNDTVGNFLYRNGGRGHFEEIAVAAGAALNDVGAPDGSMGVAVADYNLDGLPDLWVVNYERETIALYKNLGDCNFAHVSQITGVSVVGTMFVGFGTAFFDADRDGDEDVIVANGHVLRFPNNAPVRQLPLLFENLSGKRFVNVAPQAGDYCRQAHTGRGLARGDLDNDGDMDVAISHLNEPVSLLENSTAPAGGWFKIRLIGSHGNRDATGARLTLKTNRGTQVRQISSGDSYLSHSDRDVFWGIPEQAKIESVTIEWPGGKTQVLDSVLANRLLTIREPPP